MAPNTAAAARLMKNSKHTARRVKRPLAMHKRGAQGTLAQYLDRATAALALPRGAAAHFLATFADAHGATHHRWVPRSDRFPSLFAHSCEALAHKLGWRLVEQSAADGAAPPPLSEGEEFEAAIHFVLSLPCSLPQKAVAAMLGVGVKRLHCLLRKYYTVDQEDANELWPAVLEALPAGQLRRRDPADAEPGHSLASHSASVTEHDEDDEVSELRSCSRGGGRSAAKRARRASGALQARSAGVRKAASGGSKPSVSSALTSIQYTFVGDSSITAPDSPQPTACTPAAACMPAAAWHMPALAWPPPLLEPVTAGSLHEAEEAALALLGDSEDDMDAPLAACWAAMQAGTRCSPQAAAQLAAIDVDNAPPSPGLSAMSATGSSADFARLLASPSCNAGAAVDSRRADSQDLLWMLVGDEEEFGDDWLAEFAAGQGLDGDGAAAASEQAPTAVATAHQPDEHVPCTAHPEAWLAATGPASWTPAWTSHPALATFPCAGAAASALQPCSGHGSQLESSGTAVPAQQLDWTMPFHYI